MIEYYKKLKELNIQAGNRYALLLSQLKGNIECLISDGTRINGNTKDTVYVPVDDNINCVKKIDKNEAKENILNDTQKVLNEFIVDAKKIIYNFKDLKKKK